eukprot:GHVR01182492.1.p1 GENE.GHVR01182492.1~~GHVR01182492.1.p1  ORF type:complete len:101 (-),score=25.15 GHVR01182492.1:88-390(-)
MYLNTLRKPVYTHTHTHVGIPVVVLLCIFFDFFFFLLHSRKTRSTFFMKSHKNILALPNKNKLIGETLFIFFFNPPVVPLKKYHTKTKKIKIKIFMCVCV